MAKQSPTIYARTSIAVVALFTIAWSWSAFGQGNVPFAKELAKNSPYHVFLSQKPRKEHQEAIIAVVQTRTGSNAKYGLVFLQTRRTGYIGQGMVCDEAKEGEGSALECDRVVDDTKETLRVGAIDSEFCMKLRKYIDYRVNELGDPVEELYTKDKTNPVATPDECTETHKKRECVCYEIEHESTLDDDKEFLAPPNSGSGTGGHN